MSQANESKYLIEITDTYGGEANYRWIKRFMVSANSMRGAVQKLARSKGGGWKKAYGDHDSARYNLSGNCVCMFVTWIDAAEVADYPSKFVDLDA
jgi:hypothetical protein